MLEAAALLGRSKVGIISAAAAVKAKLIPRVLRLLRKKALVSLRSPDGAAANGFFV